MLFRPFKYGSRIRFDEYIVRDHRVHDVRIIPGVTFLDMVLRLLRTEGHQPERLALRQILFKEPIAVTEDYDKRIVIELEPDRDGAALRARSQKIRHGAPIEDGWDVNFECRLEPADEPPPKKLDAEALKRAASETLRADNAYGLARRSAIRHGEFMQCRGQAFLSGDACLAELRLSELAAGHLANFHLHPAILDATTLVPLTAPLCHDPQAKDIDPAIPFYIDRFHAFRPIASPFFALAPRCRPESIEADIQYFDLEIYDGDGLLAARFDRLAVKRIRSAELITRLRGHEAAAPTPPAIATAAEPRANVSPTIDWTAELRAMTAALRGVSPDQIASAAPFYDQGLESTDLLKLVQKLEARLGRKLYPTLLFEYNNIDQLAGYLTETFGAAEPAPEPAPPGDPAEPAPAAASADGVEAWRRELQAMTADLLGAGGDRVSASTPFYDQGLESTDLLKLVQKLETRLGRKLYPTLLFEYNSIDQLAAYLAEEAGIPPGQGPASTNATEPAVPAQPAGEGLLACRRVWRTQAAAGATPPSGPILIFDLDEALFDAVQKTAAESGAGPVALVNPGRGYRERSGRRFTLNPRSRDDYRQLIGSLERQGLAPRLILHYWSRKNFVANQMTLAAHLHKGVHSLLHLSAALGERKLKEPARLLYLFASHADRPQPQYAAAAGFARTVRLENPNLAFSTVELRSAASKEWDPAALAAAVMAEAGEEAVETRLEPGARQTPALVEEPAREPATAVPLKRGGVYLIAGGAGGLGLVFAEWLAKTYRAKLALTGRGALGKERTAKLKALQAAGGEIVYFRADIARRDQVAKLIAAVTKRFGRLDGVIHAAGVLRDAFAIKKTAEQMEQTLAPKVFGTVYLDEETKRLPLDFFAAFSSISAIFGNPGQCDYAFGNSFLDHFVAMREDLRAKGLRSGKSVSINWPLWREGGMAIDPEIEAMHRAQTGMTALATEPGLDFFARALAGDAALWAVVYGDRAAMRAALGLAAAPAEPRPAPPAKPPAAAKPVRRASPAPEPRGAEPIAIIGMSGRFPMAADLDAYWDNLYAGRDCIAEIPADRWDWRAFFNADRNARGGVYAKWGGFLDEIDRFDPLFFSITPRAANLIDPQERLFLETAWRAFEDAGLPPSRLAGSATGVFVGVMWGEYQLFGAEELAKGRPVSPTSSFASIANRVSYFMNLTGPSLALDTMCSSSLTSIHLACESLRRGECETALAGGVNLSLHPAKYLFLCQANMPSSDGRCRSFGEGGDGYVPGEGVGAVLLKPLSKALADGNRIDALILASAVNHGGRASGYMVPSPRSQTAVIAEALRQAEIAPESVGYIEAHGTGTELGDPIEIAGLVGAFGPRREGDPPRAIGSAKSNIGHCESAAGVAGVIKTALQFRHEAIAPSLHAEILNQKIDFSRSPFQVQREAASWPRSADAPRRAGVSSFGAGGANAHLILEEGPAVEAAAARLRDRPRVIPLSARDEERLRAQAERLLAFLRRGAATTPEGPSLSALRALAAAVIEVEPDALDADVALMDCGFDAAAFSELADQLNQRFHADLGPDRLPALSLRELAAERVAPASSGVAPPALGDLAFTLQTGREAMAERAAWIVGDHDELAEALAAFIETGAAPFRGSLEEDALGRQAEPAAAADAEDAARRWTEGAAIDWRGLYPGERPVIVAAPGYAFARERYWVSRSDAPSTAAGAPALHPLLDANQSDLDQVLFRKRLRAGEFVLADHKVNGRLILPGVAYLEMARAAGELAGKSAARQLKDVLWARPFELGAGGERDLFIALRPESKYVDFEVFSQEGGQRTAHASGKIVLDRHGQAGDRPPPLDLDAVKRRCPATASKAELYPELRRLGFDYGPKFQVTHTMHRGENEALTRLQAPEGAAGDGYALHPGLMDGMLRACMGIGPRSADQPLRLPFALTRFEWFAPLPATCYAHATLDPAASGSAELAKVDIGVYDERGEPVARFAGFTARALKDAAAPAPSAALWWLREAWTETPLPQTGDDEAVVLVVSSRETPVRALAARRSGRALWIQPGPAFRELGEDRYALSPTSPEDWRALDQALTERGLTPDAAVNLLNWPEKDPLADSDDAAFDRQIDGGLRPALGLFQAIHAAAPNRGFRLLHVYPAGTRPGDAAVAGFAKALKTVNHRFLLATLQSDAADEAALAAELADELAAPFAAGAEIRRRAGRRAVRALAFHDGAPQPAAEPVALRQGGVYLITGGAGKLGMLFARRLARDCGARLALTGRGPLDGAKRALLDELADLGGQAVYLQADVADERAVQRAVAEAKSQFGALHGVCHAAGVLGSAAVADTDWADFEKPLAPKTRGCLYLHRATAGEPLDFFALFSSISAEQGDYGAGGYAAGNKFLDRFAAWRERQRERGACAGKSLSIGWPLWREGGMDLPEQEASLYFDYAGLRMLESDQGFDAFTTALASKEPYWLPAPGDRAKIGRVLGAAPPTDPSEPATNAADSPESSSDDVKALAAKAEGYLQHKLSAIIDLPPEKIKARAKLEAYGIDSVMILELNQALEADFESLPRTLFFEYDTLRGLAAYLAEHRVAELRRATGETEPEPAAASAPPSPPAAEPEPQKATVRTAGEADIAVIGLAGRYPQSPDLDAFWENLRDGRNCIETVPAERWDWAAVYDPDKDAPGKAYSKWGGFLADIDKFDPLLFGVSPMEAETMDPQERLFLETVWAAMEDAGYPPRVFRETLPGRQAGLFVGCMYNHYPWLAADETLRAALATNSYSTIANRASYFFNFQGPSIAVDTACSGSLTAVHLACESLRRGDCGYAIAGGVNLSLHPYKYIGASMTQMLGSGDRSRSFGDGDGYTPGEGVGAALLKSLAQALADGDRVYGVIKGGAVNHGGKTNAFRVPNPHAQAEVISQALTRAGVDPATIDYVESAANGSSLGDPIEIAAMAKVFAGRETPLPVGSVKANIGHLEAASGISQLTKVLLQMRHGALTPAINADPPNPNLQLEATPFFLPDEAAAWPSRTETRDGEPAALPRRAAISSFGAGGANAHLIVEEFDADRRPPRPAPRPGPFLFTLSARTPERLRALIEKTGAHLAEAAEGLEFADLAYTALCGRDALETRLAVIVADRAELIEKLKAVLAGAEPAGACHSETAAKKGEVEMFEEDEDARGLLRTWLAKGELERLAGLWVSGLDIDWRGLPQCRGARRAPLPIYPFARKSYWLTGAEPVPSPAPADRPASPPAAALAEPPAPAEPTPTPEAAEQPASSVGEDPAGRVQAMIAEILTELLKLEEAIDIDRDLGDYGLDSLSGGRLVNRLQDRLGQRISIRAFFASPTVRDLAAYLIGQGLVEATPPNEPAADPISDILNGLAKGELSPDQAVAARERVMTDILEKLERGEITADQAVALREEMAPFAQLGADA